MPTFVQPCWCSLAGGGERSILRKCMPGAYSSVWCGIDTFFMNQTLILFSIYKINEGKKIQVNFFLKWKLITSDTEISKTPNHRFVI